MPIGRRRFLREFKVSVVLLVAEQGYTVPQAAKNLGVDPASLRGWLKKFAPGLDDG
jgi:transposase-like protein